MIYHRRSAKIGTGTYLACLGVASVAGELSRAGRRGEAKIRRLSRPRRLLRLPFAIAVLWTLYSLPLMGSIWLAGNISPILGIACFIVFFAALLLNTGHLTITAWTGK